MSQQRIFIKESEKPPFTTRDVRWITIGFKDNNEGDFMYLPKDLISELISKLQCQNP